MICERQIEVVVVAPAFSTEVVPPPILEVVVLEGVRPFPVAGAGITMALDETPSGAIDGINTNFTTAFPFQLGGLLVHVNGLRQRDPQDYAETSSQTFALSQAPLAGDSVRVDYLRL